MAIELPGNFVLRENTWQFFFVLRESTWQFYCQYFPVSFTVYGNFYGNFPVKGLFLRVFTVFSCKTTVNRKTDVRIYVKNFTVFL